MELSARAWPKTVEEAVDSIISSIARDERDEIAGMAQDDLILLHLGFGENIRNQCGRWAGNKELLESCGSETLHPDEASIIEAL